MDPSLCIDLIFLAQFKDKIDNTYDLSFTPMSISKIYWVI